MTKDQEMVIEQARVCEAYYRVWPESEIPPPIVGVVRAVRRIYSPNPEDDSDASAARKWLNSGETKFDKDAPLSVIAAHVMGELKAARAASRKDNR